MSLFPRDAYAMLSRVLEPDRPTVFIDVGANVGQTCRRICDVFWHAQVYAFEPAPHAAAKLREQTSDLRGVHVIEWAVGDRTGQLDLHLTRDSQMSSALLPSTLGRRYYGADIDSGRTVRVPVTRLDDFVALRGLERVDVLKIDVQGLECAVLTGARDLLSRGDVMAVNCEAQLLEEYDGASTFAQIDAQLRGHGYVLHQIHECWSRGPEEQTSCIDGLWLRRDVLETLRERCAGNTPQQRLLRAARHCAAAGKKSLALYSAGRHTRALAPMLDQCAAPVTAIIDDAPQARALAIAGRPVIAPSQARAKGIDAVILSSECYEQELWEAAAPLREQGVLVLPLYHARARSAITGPSAPRSAESITQAFRYPGYLRLNQVRLDHLASLGLALAGQRTLEVGAGIGDLTPFLVNQGCFVHATDARPEHVRLMAQAFERTARVTVGVLDLDAPMPFEGEPFDTVFSYGLLYHLHDPGAGLAYMAAACGDLLVLETCVSFGDHEAVNPVAEDAANPSQARSGLGCRPTRPWVYARLREAFGHVYMPPTQPDHEQFPVDWTGAPPAGQLTRAIFVASRRPLRNPLLVEGIPATQTRARVTEPAYQGAAA